MIKNLDVICIGAALVDMVANVERHPLEDDEVFVSDLKLLSGGAAANTAYACAKLGLKTAFIGKLGYNDEFGNKIISDFKEVSMDTSLIKYSNDYGTGSAYIALNSEGSRRIYAHSGAANYLSKDDIITEELLRGKLIYLSSLKNIEPFIEAAEIGRENYIPVILNPGMLIIDQGLDNIIQLFEKIDILILSQREYMTLLNIQGPELREEVILDTSNNILKLGIKVIIITMGSNGAYLLTKNDSAIIPAKKVKNVIDTTGAGDAFSAGFIFRFVQHLGYDFTELKFNVEFGNLIAGRCIQKLGARKGIPSRKELMNFID